MNNTAGFTNNENTNLPDYPFDLYQRYRDIRETVEMIAGALGKPSLKILDVGGYRADAEDRDDLLLREFLPQHRIFALDLVSSTIPGYVQGDGSQLPFKDNSFDIVVSSDVYEHIPADKRIRFLENLLTATKADGFVILGAPFYSEKTALAENIVFEYVRKSLHVEHAQLKEHIENRLPDAGELRAFLEGRGLQFTCFDSGNLDNWLAMMLVIHYLMTIPGTEKLRTLLDRFYNMSGYERDHRVPGYRKMFIIAAGKNSQDILNKIEGHFSNYASIAKTAPGVTGDWSHLQMLLSLEELRTRRLFEDKERIICRQAARLDQLNRMMSTRFYRFTRGVGKLFFRPVAWVSRVVAVKCLQLFEILTGKRRHPLLSLSSGMYRRWLKKNTPSPQDLAESRQKSREWKDRPLISIVVPVYNTKAQWLEEALASVKSQVYEQWELCIVNDGSGEKHVKEILDREKSLDPRIKVKHLRRNRGIALASNQALTMASGQFIAFMDSDDVLHPTALFEVVSLLNKHPVADVIFSDEDKLTLQGKRKKPVFKPGWSPDLFLTHNYINHLTVIRKKKVDEAGGFRPEYTWSQDYDLYLRITEKTREIYHIPKVLYHWRAVPGSSASKVDIRGEALMKNTVLLTETLQRRGIPGFVKKGLKPGTFKIKVVK